MDLRNIAIIAHVDHGKTTLVDALLKQSASFKQKTAENGDLIMDSNELERERGITIFSKNASVIYKDTKINIVDTPGHADFGGEVERIMRMVDGVLLLVDAKEGPMPQTKFVLRKAIQAGHKIVVVVNKIDKPDARAEWALNATYDLFFELDATEEQIDFPVIYAAAREGKAGLENDLSKMTDISAVFETIVSYLPPPKKGELETLQFLTVNLAYDNYKGKIAIGRLYSGEAQKEYDHRAHQPRGRGQESAAHFRDAVRRAWQSGSGDRRQRGTSWRSRGSRTSRSAKRSPTWSIRWRCRRSISTSRRSR